jgi:hypothetical protein
MNKIYNCKLRNGVILKHINRILESEVVLNKKMDDFYYKQQNKNKSERKI